MAKRSSARSLARPRPRTVKPTIIRTTVVKKAPRKHHKGGAGGHGLTSKKRMGIIIGGAALGALQKAGTLASFPELPLIGATGTVGVVAYFLSDNGKNQLADQICTAALTLAAFEFTSAGKIIGGAEDPWDMSGYVAGS